MKQLSEIKNQLILFSSLILLLLVGFKANAQTKEIENYQFNDSLVGVLKYDYKLQAKDTIYDGDYFFKSTTENGRDDYRFLMLNYNGVFKDDQKDGEWVFVRKKMNTSNDFFVENYTVNYFTEGVEDQITANFTKGLADGKWIYIKQNFEKSIPTDTLFKSEITLSEAKMMGEVTADSEQISLKGNFNQDGHLDGNWEITHRFDDVELLEIKEFKNGVFKRNYFIFNEGEVDIEYIGFDTTLDDDEDNWVEIDIDQHYFDIFDLTNVGIEDEISFANTNEIKKILQHSNQFIQNTIMNFGYYNGLDIWKSVRGNEVINYGKFRVRKFDYSEEEEEQLSETQELLDFIQSSIEEFKDNSKVTLGMPAYEELNRINRVFEIYEKELSGLERLVETINNDAFQYVKREQLFPNFAPKISFPDEISYEFQDDSKSVAHDFPDTKHPKEFSIQVSYDLLKAMANDIETLNDELAKVLNRMEKEESLLDDEEELVNLKNEIERKFDKTNELKQFNQFHKEIGEDIIQFTKDNFNAYGRLQVDEKKDLVDEYLNCFKAVLGLWDRLIEFEEELDEIDEEYTRTVFNPFMMTDISERVKERVYDAFNDFVLPYVIKDLKKAKGCTTIEKKIENLTIVYTRMIEIREQDTKEEERALRRERDTNKILSILKIELN